MARRPGIMVQTSVPADGGKPPNRYVPYITAEMRIHWPPQATEEQILAVWAKVSAQAAEEVRAKIAELRIEPQPLPPELRD